MVTTELPEACYNYRFPSFVELNLIRLAASGGIARANASANFFEGQLNFPRQSASLLLTLSQLVRTHFFDARPPQMDPIVTTSKTLLRLEGFSGCCGAYARLDLDDEAVQSEHREFGTTNVDFNPTMLSHLSGVSSADNVGLKIATDSLTVVLNETSVIEKRVTLPKRWIKGLCEVQVYQSRLRLRQRFNPAAIVPLIQAASSTVSTTQFLTVSGGRPRLSLRQSGGAIAVGGLNRLAVLRTLLPIVREVNLYADDESGVHAWVAELPWARLWLVLSPSLQRGFSGEGQALSSLALGQWSDKIDAVHDLLAGTSLTGPTETIDPAEIAAQLGYTTSDAYSALAVLAANGLAGFDASSGYYFQRRLPFNLDLSFKQQPRMRAAQQLLDAGAVRIVKSLGDQECEIEVSSGDMVYFVRLRPEGDRCSCPWFSRHQGQQGPCKHLLAARMLVEKQN